MAVREEAQHELPCLYSSKEDKLLAVFTYFASWLVYDTMGLDSATRLGQSIHFFVDGLGKIIFLLAMVMYLIAFARTLLDLERIKHYLQGKSPFFTYTLGAGFGALTPYCACSSIPLFLWFTRKGLPLGFSIAFLIASPTVNEVAVIMLWGLLGWKFTLTYILVGMLVGIVSGALLHKLRAERWLEPYVIQIHEAAEHEQSEEKNRNPQFVHQSMTFSERHLLAWNELKIIFFKIWKGIIIGVAIGAILNGYVPDRWLAEHLGSGQWWTVPIATLLGLPLYANTTSIIPILESLIIKGLPVGTTLTFCMSIVTASIPEFAMLKQVMQWRLLIILFFMLIISFTIVGWTFNAIGPWLY